MLIHKITFLNIIPSSLQVSSLWRVCRWIFDIHHPHWDLYLLPFSDVLVLNDIINQTVGTPETGGGGPTPNMLEPQQRPLSTLVEPRHNSVQSSAASGTAAALARARRESRKISMMLDDDDSEGPRIKERIAEACQQFIDIFCVWDCCWFYIKLSEVSNLFV